MFEKSLSTGVISVTPSMAHWPLNALFDIAERRNPKRAFLFVSKVLGRHIPVPPATMRKVYKDLAKQIPNNLPEPILFVGMAETAVGLAAGIHDEYRVSRNDTVLLTSTRHPVEADLLCEFKENHSHATDHLIYWPIDPALAKKVKNAASLVLIDDEATTGNTFINLYRALNSAGLTSFKNVVTVTLTDWSQTSLHDQLDIPVLSVALAKGSWKWEPKENAKLPEMPNVGITAKGSVTLSPKQDWGRLGVTDSKLSLGENISVKAGEKILVLGTSEFVWQPFLLAERLEIEGANVLFGSITRSPIAIGHAIDCAYTFGDNYGLGIANFVYNVNPDNFDRIYICCETPKSSIDQTLISSLNKAEVISYA